MRELQKKHIYSIFSIFLSTLCMYIFVQIVHNINIYLHFSVHLLDLCPAALQIHAHFPSLVDISRDQDRMYRQIF
jgi:hypothetical protein